MRWDALFDDLHGQLASEHALEFDAELVELSRLELTQISFLDRLRANAGEVVSFWLCGGSRVSGSIARIGDDWLLLYTQQGRSVVVRQAQILVAEGVGFAAKTGYGRLNFSFGGAMRALSKARATVTLEIDAREPEESNLTGVIERVGVDFLELSALRDATVARRSNIARRLLLPFAGIRLVKAHGGNQGILM